jgi:Tfp pilus assembly protein PilN
MSIHLNHAKSSHAANGWAIALLVSGCVLSAILFWHYLNLSSAINLLQTELQQLTLPKQTLRAAKAASSNNAKESAQAVAIQAAIVDIKTPWQHLLNPLEAATNDDIKLLSLESNAKTKQLRLSAVTLTIDRMMAYINRLSAQPTLQQVRLVSHEAMNANGTPAITFNVEALWQAP